VLNRRQAAAAVAVSLSGLSRAQAAYPTKPIRVVVPFNAGGIADLTARVVGEALSPRLRQPVLIDNRPGAGGVVAGELVARAEPDGHTLFLMSNGTAVSAGLFKHLPFDAQKDFAPVSLLGLFDLAVIVPAASRFASLQDLLAAAKAQPRQLNIATVNVGSTQHLAAELLKTTAGIDVQVVPFNGTPLVISALRGGQVDAAVEILGPVKSQITAGALRALAVLGEKRPAALPQVPTVAESGGRLSRFKVSSWNALAAPARTAPAIVQRLNTELQAVLSTPNVRSRLAELDVEARGSTPEQLATLLAEETRRWGEVITRAGIAKQ